MKLTIAKRLFPVIAAAICGVTLMAAVGQYMNEKIYSSTNFTNKNVIPSLLYLDEMRKNYLLSRLATYHLSIASTDAERALQLNRIATYRLKLEEALNKYEYNGCFDMSCIADDDDKNLLYKEKALIGDIGPKLQQAANEATNGDAAKAKLTLLGTSEQSEKLQSIFDEHFRYNVRLGKRSAEQGVTEKTDALYLLLLLGLATLVVIGVIGYASVRSILNLLGGEPEEAAEIATQLALGDLSSHIQTRPGDSTSLMAKMQQLILTMEKVADRADMISRGNLSDEVTVLSDKDRLGNAINHMVTALRTARNLDDRRNWLNDGSNQLSLALTGDYSTKEIAEIAINTIGRYMGAGRGVFYALRDDAPILDLIASFMYTDDINYRPSFRIGEGAIGQVAKEKMPIILASVNNTSALIVTGTTNIVPVSTFTFPILKDKQLFGVIEFSSMEPFSEIKLDYLTAAIDVIASFMYVAQQRGQIHALLAVSEQAERDVRKQNEFLQEINSRMEEQQQQLQQQSEELQQTNAQMEEQHQLLEHNNEKLRQSEAEINEKARQLEMSNQYKSEFLANMSHELRTPLNAIILLSKMMLENPDGNLNAKEIKRAEVIHHSGQDLLALINEVLDLSKVDAGRMEINRDDISSMAISGEMRDVFESIAEAKKIHFDIVDQIHGKFSSDKAKVIQILRNLLSNAFKFTKNGSVTLTMKTVHDNALPIQLVVTDTGIGIPRSKFKTIFDAFRQVDGSTSREYGGTGLGLTISLRFAELLGGTISLTSAEGKGSEFTLSLPLTTPEIIHSPTIAVYPSEKQKSQSIEAPGKKPGLSSTVADDRNDLKPRDKIILLIDDDPNFGNAVVEINQRLGYKTVVAQSGTEGLQLAKQYRPAGILLDLGLPDKDGTDVLHELKSNADLASTPVYIVSGRDHDSAFNQHDIVGYLQKPLVSSQIEQAEADLLDAIRQTRSNGILIVSDTPDNQVAAKLGSSSITYDIHNITIEQALDDGLDLRDWGVAVIDLSHLTIEQGLRAAKQIRSVHPSIALLFFGNTHFNDDEEASLLTYTDSIIINAPHAGQRLQENIERFLNAESGFESPSVAITHKVNPDKNLANKKILVIDDDPRNLFVITAALEQNNATVLNALNGKRALEMLEKKAVDLVITDIMMPEMDGYQTIAAIRANPKLASMPIIALTAKAMPEDKKNILEMGADDYLAKPVDYEILCNMAALWSSSRHTS